VKDTICDTIILNIHTIKSRRSKKYIIAWLFQEKVLRDINIIIENIEMIKNINFLSKMSLMIV
jgi:hypothetical protein